MTQEKQSGQNWSRVSELYARVVNELDPESPNGVANREILNIVDRELPFHEASFILDLGTGPGPLISGVLNSPTHCKQISKDARIVAADISSAFVSQTEARKQRNIYEGHTIWERLEVRQWDALDLSEQADNSVSHLLSSYLYSAMRDGAQQGLRESLRVLQPGGLLVAANLGPTHWGKLPEFIQAVRPEKAIPSSNADSKRWWTPESVQKVLTDAGFKDVSAKAFEVSMPLDKHADAVEFVLEGFPFVKPLMADMSEEEKTKVVDLMYGFLKQQYPEEPFRLKGTAVVGWGSK